jgi:hypothetical protein
MVSLKCPTKDVVMFEEQRKRWDEKEKGGRRGSRNILAVLTL